MTDEMRAWVRELRECLQRQSEIAHALADMDPVSEDGLRLQIEFEQLEDRRRELFRNLGLDRPDEGVGIWQIQPDLPPPPALDADELKRRIERAMEEWRRRGPSP